MVHREAHSARALVLLIRGSQGDITYGKFLGGKAAFATVEFYTHLMNWRQSLPKYRAALGERYPAKTRSEKIMMAVSAAVTPSLIRNLGPSYKSNLVPSIKKSICDTVVQFLEMGT